MPNGILIIDKPQGWTASEFALTERRIARDSAYPGGRLHRFAAHPLRWDARRGKGAACCSDRNAHH